MGLTKLKTRVSVRPVEVETDDIEEDFDTAPGGRRKWINTPASERRRRTYSMEMIGMKVLDKAYGYGGGRK